MSRPARALALAAAVAPLGMGALAARALARHRPTALALDFAQPLVVATNWHRYGTEAFALLAASVALSALLLVATIARLRARAGVGDVVAIAFAALVGLAGAAAWPFVFSSDVYAYAAYGHMALHALDPYAPAPPALHDAFLDAARWQWGGTFPVDVYGPGTLALAQALVALAGDRAVAPALVAMRCAAAAAFLASIVVAYASLRGRPEPARFTGICAFALNPVILWSVAEGHNDAFVLLVVALAALAIARGRAAVGAIFLGLEPILKAPGLALAVGFALEAFVRRRPRASREVAIAGLAALAVATALSLPPLLRALGHIARVGTYAPRVSLQGLVGIVPALGLASGAAGIGLVRLVRRDARGYAWLGIALVAALPNAYPWYALWLVPWAIAAGGGSAAGGLWLATIVALARYLPDASQTLSAGPARLLAAIAVAPLALAAFDVVPRSPQKESSP